MKKVQLILVDGMRPDALALCKNPYVEELLQNSLYTLKARTTTPSVTLPCHMSLFFSVTSERHGITTNTYVPQVRPINGLFEQLKTTKKCGFFYDWEQLRDLSSPGSLTISYMVKGDTFGYEKSCEIVTDASIRAMAEYDLDFTFTYLGWPDAAGHQEGWMGEEYMRSLDKCFDCIKRLIDSAPKDTVTILLADHGGHDRTHGTTLDSDMLIPIILNGAGATGEITRDVSIKDIAPTIVKLLDGVCAPEWEGTSIL